MNAPSKPARVLIGGVSVDWLAMVADLLRKEGRAFRPGAGPWIEIQNISTGRFEPLALDRDTRGGVTFATIADRDDALRAIESIVYPVLVLEFDTVAAALPAACPICRGEGYTTSLGGVTRDCDCVRAAARLKP